MEPPRETASWTEQDASPRAGALAPAVFILSDVRLYREGLTHSLSRRSELRVMGSAPPAAVDFSDFAGSEVAILFLDATMPVGLSILRRLKEIAPHAKVVAISVNDCEDEQMAYVEAGVAGYVTRDGSIDEVVNAALRVMRGEVACSQRLAARLFDRVASLSEAARAPTGTASLTPRERDIVDLVNEGLSNKQIARTLRIGLPTVKNHVHNILEKLQVRRRGEAAAWARSQGPGRLKPGVPGGLGRGGLSRGGMADTPAEF